LALFLFEQNRFYRWIKLSDEGQRKQEGRSWKMIDGKERGLLRGI